MKKSQAAIEFLSTYGWALLSVLIIIGALTYFGIFNTRKMVQDYCSFSEELKCEDYQIHQDGWVEVRLRNNFGKDITLVSFSASSDEGGSSAVCSINNDVIAGNPGLAGCNMPKALAKGDKIKVKGIVTFKRSGSSNIHNVTGELYATIQGPSGTCADTIWNCHVGPCGSGCENETDKGSICSGPSC